MEVSPEAQAYDQRKAEKNLAPLAPGEGELAALVAEYAATIGKPPFHVLANPRTWIGTYTDPSGGEWDIRSYADGHYDASQTNGDGLTAGYSTLVDLIEAIKA